MRHKHNVARRHHIGKMKFQGANWQEHEADLRRRGSLTLWIRLEALSGWVLSQYARRVEASLRNRIWRSKRGRCRAWYPDYGCAAVMKDVRVRCFISEDRICQRLITRHPADGPEPGSHWPEAKTDSLWRLGRFMFWSTAPGYGAGQWLEEKHSTSKMRLSGWKS